MSSIIEKKFKHCHICDDLTSKRIMRLKKKNIRKISESHKHLDALMNIWYIKIINRKKNYLCKKCFTNMCNAPSFHYLRKRELGLCK